MMFIRILKRSDELLYEDGQVDDERILLCVNRLISAKQVLNCCGAYHFSMSCMVMSIRTHTFKNSFSQSINWALTCEMDFD